MVLTVPDRVAARLRALADARGETIDAVATELLEASPELPDPTPAADSVDLLEAFIGCGASGDSTPRSIHEMRRELAARKLAGGIENI